MRDTCEFLALLRRTCDLMPAQRLVIVLCAVSEADRGGVVHETGRGLAQQLGMTPTVFSRLRKRLVRRGWLEELERFAHISYYRLSSRALGEGTVVPMRRAM